MNSENKEKDILKEISEAETQNQDPSSENDELYQEILEKLNIEKTDIEDETQEIQIKEQSKTTMEEQLKITVKPEIDKIVKLMKMGVITPLQGQNLMNHVVEKAYNSMVQNGTSSPNSMNLMDKTQAFFEFNKEYPEFFNENGRNEVLNYLKTDGLNFDKDELTKISKLIEIVEQKAIERYLKKQAYEENMQKLNEAAKLKLQANAQNRQNGSKNLNVFTREQIGKMSGADFAKYEKLIMEQVQKGLIH